MSTLTDPDTDIRTYVFAPDVPPPVVQPKPAPSPAAPAEPLPLAAPPQRLVSLDAYRGLVMVLMISAGLYLPGVFKSLRETPGLEYLGHSTAWRTLAYHTDHAGWAGCSLWDLIQPSFMFMVGSAMAFSVASRRAKGQSFWRMLGHAVVRSAVLVLFGVYFATNKNMPRANWSFTNVLAQIGLGYTFLFLLAWLRPRWQILAAFGILAAYWAAFALYRNPHDAEAVAAAAPKYWHRFADTSFASHWDQHTNFAARFDRWFLNLFARWDGKPFVLDDGGYQTLNFVPSLATMVFGLLAGQLLRGGLTPWRKVGLLVGLGLGGLAAGILLWPPMLEAFPAVWQATGRAPLYAGVCPIVKRIWTPSWTIFSAGWAFLLLGLFYLVVDVWRFRKWAYPLVVVGANSILIYCVSQTMKPWVKGTVRQFLGRDVYDLPGRAWAWLRYDVLKASPPVSDPSHAFGAALVPAAEATVFLAVCWLICWGLYRKKAFFRI